MARHWFRKPSMVISVPFVFALVLAVACGSAAEPEVPAPTTGPAAVEATQAPAPTAEPQATGPAADSMMAGVEYAPSFAEYWQPPTEAYGQPVRGGTLRVIYEDPLEHANTWGATTGAADRMRNFTANKIVTEDPYQPGEIIPDLAQGWTQKEDATGITFHFHDNITWHPSGDPFVCEDARFWIETMLTGEGITASAQGANLNFIDLETTTCVDDGTLEVGFTGPSAIALPAFAKADATVFKKDWFLAGGEEAMFQDLSVGHGPFIWEPGQEMGTDTQRFVRNPNYFKGDGALPYLDNLVLVGIVDESAQQAALLAHQGDWHWVRNWGQYDAYVGHDKIRTVINTTRGHSSFWMNRRNPPFDNVRVRQAIVMGIDRAGAIKVLQQTHGSEGFIMSPGSPWELDREKGCAVPGWCITEDMDARRAEARKILEEEGFDFNKTYLYTVESDAQVQARSIYTQEQLRLLGIKTEFDLVETVTYRAQTSEGTWGDMLVRNDTMPADDPCLGMGHYFSSKSLSNNHWVPVVGEFDDRQKQADELLAQVCATVDPVERKALSDQLQLLAMENYWKFPVFWEQEAAAFWPEVRGYFHAPQPSGAHRKWDHVWVDPSHKGDTGFQGQTTGLPGGI